MKVHWILALGFLASLSGCATPLNIGSDHDPANDFSAYRTFAWMADRSAIAASEAGKASPLNRRRIEVAIEDELTSKGFQKVPEGAAADFVVSFSVGARDRLEAHSYPAPYAGDWRWGRRYFGHDVDVLVYTEGALGIDVFDGKTHQPVWHGWASKRITDEDVRHAAEQIPTAVAKVLGNFPPRKTLHTE